MANSKNNCVDCGRFVRFQESSWTPGGKQRRHNLGFGCRKPKQIDMTAVIAADMDAAYAERRGEKARAVAARTNGSGIMAGAFVRAGVVLV